MRLTNQTRKIFEMAARVPAGIQTKNADIEVQIKAIRDEIISKVGANADAQKAMQKQLDALDLKMAERHFGGGGGGVKTLESTLKENDSINRLLTERRGRATLELDAKQTKALLASATGFQTTGVLEIDRMQGITAEARETLTIRDALASAPTTQGVVDYVKVLSAMSAASPQVEGSTKYPNSVTFTSASERVKTIATYIDASRQILDDMAELQNFLETTLAFEVSLAEEIELLSGSNVGEHLNGLIPQATAFSTSLLPAAGTYNKIDIVARAIQQIRVAKEVMPTFVVLHPTDWWGMRLTKDGFGRYILGDPQATVAPSLFGKAVIETTNIAAGTFLVGSGNAAAAQIRDRMGLTVDISFENNDNFQKNMVTIRAERRLALVVRRPASFVTGTLINSPA